jgi:hypothetical protein
MRSIPAEPGTPAAWPVSPTGSPASLVRALLSVAPNSIWPSHDPAMAPAIPASRGLRCKKEGCVAGVGWAVGAGLPAADCGAVAAGRDVVDC